MGLQLDRLLKSATAGAFALVMVAGCNTFEGVGEDVADAGDAIQRVGDTDSSEHVDRSEVEIARSETHDSSDRQWSSRDSEVSLQAQRHDAGLFSAEGRKIDAQQRQQMASSQMRNQSQQQTAQRSDRSTDVFGFAEDPTAPDQQKLTGTIADVARVPHITLKTDDGREVVAMLNEAQSREIQQLQQGQKVTLIGSMRDHEGQQVFVVQRIEKAQTTQSPDRNANADRNSDQAFGFAADQNAEQRAHADKVHKKHALVGTIEKIEDAQGGKGPHLMVKSDKGNKTYHVDLTGVDEARLLKTEINEGDKVTLIGSLAKADPAQAEPVHQVFKAEKMHKGVHAEAVQAYAFVGEGEQISGNLAVIELDAAPGARAMLLSEGRHIPIDLSQIDKAKLEQLNLRTHQAVTVTGSFEPKGDTQVFVATDIKLSAQQEGEQQKDQPSDQPAQRSGQAPANQPEP